MIVIIDNYDSYVFNLAQAFGRFNEDIKICKNDEVSIDELEKDNIKLLVVSPGPGRPEDAGISVQSIRHFIGKVPIFGVCLGLQCMAVAFNSRLDYALSPMHGKRSSLNHNNAGIFHGLPPEFKVVRYNSLVVDEKTVDTDLLEITARCEKGEIMAMSHRENLFDAVQFHPESFGTEFGVEMIGNVYDRMIQYWDERAGFV